MRAGNQPGTEESSRVTGRMGIHSGPVNEITDLNEQANIAGAGINSAQRVMDCGDAGHILLSKRVADLARNCSEFDSARIEFPRPNPITFRLTKPRTHPSPKKAVSNNSSLKRRKSDLTSKGVPWTRESRRLLS